MSREMLPLTVGDIASFARTLSRALHRQLDETGRLPSHVELLNMLARAVGHGNFQQFRAGISGTPVTSFPAPLNLVAEDTAAASRADEDGEHPEAVNPKRLRRLAGYFDERGRLKRWPPKYTQRLSCLWVMWARVTARTGYSEQQLNDLLTDNHLFGDHALLRREMVDNGMLRRTPDGRRYERVELPPPPEAAALLERLRSIH